MNASYGLIRATKAAYRTMEEAANAPILTVMSAHFCDAGKMPEGKMPGDVEQLHTRGVTFRA
jgi:hypothetical protein